MDIRRHLVAVVLLAIGTYNSLCFSSHLKSSFVILLNYYRIIFTHSLKLYWGKNKNKFVFSGQGQKSKHSILRFVSICTVFPKPKAHSRVYFYGHVFQTSKSGYLKRGTLELHTGLPFCSFDSHPAVATMSIHSPNTRVFSTWQHY